MGAADTFARPWITSERRPDGTVLLRSTAELGPHAEHLGQELRRWAEATPDAVLATAPEVAGGRQELTYREARRAADALAGGLLHLGATPDRPVMLLSGNSLDHLLLTLACYTAGVPAVPVSVAYSLQSADHHQLRAMAELVRPAVVVAEGRDRFGAAVDAVVDVVDRAVVVVPDGGAGTTALEDLRRPVRR